MRMNDTSPTSPHILVVDDHREIREAVVTQDAQPLLVLLDEPDDAMPASLAALVGLVLSEAGHAAEAVTFLRRVQVRAAVRVHLEGRGVPAVGFQPFRRADRDSRTARGPCRRRGRPRSRPCRWSPRTPCPDR